MGQTPGAVLQAQIQAAWRDVWCVAEWMQRLREWHEIGLIRLDVRLPDDVDPIRRKRTARRLSKLMEFADAAEKSIAPVILHLTAVTRRPVEYGGFTAPTWCELTVNLAIAAHRDPGVLMRLPNDGSLLAHVETECRLAVTALERTANAAHQAAAADTEAAVIRDDKAPSSGRAAKAKPKRPGRKKADYETVQKEAKIVAQWERARDAGAYKPVFAKDHGMTMKQLKQLLDRVAKRTRPSE